MWRTLRASCAVLALTASAAQAGDAQQRYNPHGLGRLQCGRFVELCEKSSVDCKLTGTWIDGYISALNALNPETFDLLAWQDSSVVAEFAFNICKRNEKAVLIEAINEVVRQALVPGRIKSAAERVRIGEGSNAAFLYKDSIRAMQQRLVDAGHLKGGVDGSFGPGTKSAVTAFQQSIGLEATGIPDQRTLAALFYARPRAGGEAVPARQPARAAPAAGAPAANPPAGRGNAPEAPPLDLNLLAPRSP